MCAEMMWWRGGGGGGGGEEVVAAPLLSPLSFFFSRKPVLSVHHIKEDIQAIHMQMVAVI